MTWIALILTGGIVALDATAFAQLMLSRPLIAGTIAGLIVGMPLEGALLGAMLEMMSLSTLPVGAARYPETGTATVAAVGTLGMYRADYLAGMQDRVADAVLVAWSPASAAPVLLLALAWGLLWQRIAGQTVILGRKVNERLVRAGRADSAGLDRVIEYRHVGSMAVDVVRGCIVTAAALALGVLVLRWAAPLWDASAGIASAVIAVAAAAMLAATAPLFADSTRGRIYLAAGVLTGCLLLILRQ